MFFKIKSYIQFLWHSKNEHAVHSPFVFQLVTKCLYAKTEKPPYFPDFSTKNKKEKLLNRLFHYFQFQEGFYFLPTKKLDINTVSKLDFVWIDVAFFIENQLEIATLLAKSHNETCFILESINHNSTTQLFWKSIVSNPKFNVTVETFTFGLTFIRTEQAKENFVIRV
jgi:hypothetical protein